MKRLRKITEIATLPKEALFQNYTRYRSQILIPQVQDLNKDRLEQSCLNIDEATHIGLLIGTSFASLTRNKKEALVGCNSWMPLIEYHKILDKNNKFSCSSFCRHCEVVRNIHRNLNKNTTFKNRLKTLMEIDI